MESKGKSGWGLPVIVAVGAFAYYCSTLKLAPSPQQRRRVILRRLHDGTSPRTLLAEGYTHAELLGAGVPRTSLSPASSPTTSTTRHYRDSLSPSPSEDVSRSRQRKDDSPTDPGSGGVMHWLYGSLHSVTGTIRAASSALADNLRGHSVSTVHGEAKTGSARNARTRPATSPSSTATATSNKTARSGATHTTPCPPSVRLSSALLLSSSKAEKSVEFTSPECSRSRTPGGAVQVCLAALSAAVARGYTEESSSCRYPLEMLRFLHEDGSRLSIMAEDCAAVECDGVMTTEKYVQLSLARARVAADATKAYFKVKLSTAARNIATTVMKSYVNVHVGPSPVILASFYLYSRGTAYTIQLQTHTGVYEARLSDLLYTAQSARLRESGADGVRSGGHCVYQMQADGAKGSSRCYRVEVPLELVARATPTPSGRRNSLTLTPRNAKVFDAACSSKSAVVTLTPSLNASVSSSPGATTLLRDAHVAIILTPAPAPAAAVQQDGDDDDTDHLSEVWKQVKARCDSADSSDKADVNAYVSSSLAIPLPPPEHFCTTVCEHPRDASVTLFIAAAMASCDADLFEVELRCMNGLSGDDLSALFAYLEALFLTPSRPQRSVNGAGQETFALEGLAVTLPETSLRVYGVQVCEGSWFVVRWLYADSAVFPRELEQYCRSLVDNVACVE
ncbi:hypothetical protein NQL31_007647 [Lotmaria passim]